MVALYDKFKSQNVEFLSINVEEDQDAAKAFVEKQKPGFPVFLAQPVGEQYGVNGIPHTVFFGKDGKLRFREIGFNPVTGEDEFTIILEELLKEK